MIVCLFDIDGTLIHTGGAGRLAFARALADEFALAEFDEDIHTTGRTDRAIAADLFRCQGIEETLQNWRRFRQRYLQHLPDALAECEGTTLPGVVSLLGQLHARDDVLLGLLTGNIGQAARQKLEYYELQAYFDFGGFGDDHEDRDDVARIAWQEALRRAGEGTLLRQCWVIGDTPHDVRCARAIAARCLAVATGMHRADELAAAEPDLLLDDLSDPARWLNLLPDSA